MKMLLFIASLLLAGCSTGTQHREALTAMEAKTLAQHLANNEALAKYSCQPFRDGPAARLEQGKWVWRDMKGVGQLELEARVIVAIDGSTNSVKIKLLDIRNDESHGF